MSYRDQRGRGAVPPPPQPPYPPRPPRRGDNWTPNAFSPAIFLVALVVIAFLVAAAYFSQRGSGDTGSAPGAIPPGTTMPTGATATGNAGGAPTATGTGRSFVVANTGGEGVYLRRTPRLADRDTAYPEGTRLTAIGPDVNGDGQRWLHVRTPDGKTGYVPAQYTSEVPR